MLDRPTLELAASLLLFGERELTTDERARLLAAAGVRDAGGPALRRAVATEARAAIVAALPRIVHRHPGRTSPESCGERDPRSVPLALVRELLDKEPERLPGAHPLVVRAPDGSTLFQQSAESVPAVGDVWVQWGERDRFGVEHPRTEWVVARRSWSHVATTALCARLDVVRRRPSASARLSAWARRCWALAVTWFELARL